MNRALAVARRILMQLRGDLRTVCLLLVAPLFVVFLLHEVVAAGDPRARVAVVGSPRLAQALESRAEVSLVSDEASAAVLLSRGAVDATVFFDEKGGLLGSPPRVMVDAADPSASAASLKAVREAFTEYLQTAAPALAKLGSRGPALAASYVNGSEKTSLFDFLAPVVLGFLVFFFTFLLGGIAFLRERSSGTLERAFAAPIRRRDLVAGYMMGFGTVAAVQTAALQLFVVGVYGAPSASGFLPTLVVNLSVAFTALSLGLFLSAYANSEFQMLQFVPVVVVPQVLFAGLFNLRSGPSWMRAVADLFPLTYAGRALRDLMIRGRGLRAVAGDLAILLAFGICFLVLAVRGLGRYRGEGGVFIGRTRR